MKLVQGYGLSETGFLTALLDDEHTATGSCPAAALVPASTSGSWTSRGRKSGPGSMASWSPGANVMRGYWNNPEETSREFRGGLFRTGDVGYQNPDGYFFILDRLKDMIVTGGENVYSGEVEAVIYSHPAVREAAVFGIPDPKWGELVTACVVLKPGSTLAAEELIAHCRRLLANYKVPRRVEFSESELSKGGSGKILKRVLREHFGANQQGAILSNSRVGASPDANGGPR